MTRCRLVSVAALAWQLSAGAGLAAQTTGTLEVGVSAVDYETFLGTAAVYLVPTIRFEHPGVSLGAQANYVRFESGNQIVQGSAAAGWLTPVRGRVRAELAGSARVAAYTGAARYGHVLARGRVHLTGSRAGVWVGGATGQTFRGDTSVTPYEVALGAWTVESDVTFAASVTGSWFANAAYADVVANVQWAGDRIELDGAAGVRAVVTGVESGAYGELTLRVPVSRHLAIQVSGGSYPTDPVRGSLAASYASVGLRLTTASGRGAPARALRDALARAFDELSRSTDAAAVRLTVEPGPDGTPRLRVVAPGADAVEIMGDFTDWEPAALVRLDRETFELAHAIPPGVHRLAVRLDGGPWLVPGGTRAEQDDFGGRVGVLVVP